MTHLPRSLRRLRARLLAHRRPLAVLCALAAVLVSVQATRVPPPARTMVLTAAVDLPAGVVVRASDLSLTPFDPASVPSGVLPSARSAIGRTTSAPVRRGEPLTDVRLVTGSLLRGRPGQVGVPVRIGDAAEVRLLRVGDRVDLVAADPQGDRPARTVAVDVPVLAVPRTSSQGDGLTSGALVVVGVPSSSAETVAQASVTAFLSVVLIG
jgi:Flp pilus assembly protein CpaB